MRVRHINVTNVRGAKDYDVDDDGLPDYRETEVGLSIEEDDRDGDPDGDGLTNLEEWLHGTHPLNPDTDFDGVNDGDEIIAGTDPLVGRWPDLRGGRIPAEPSDDDVAKVFQSIRADITAPLEQRIALLDVYQTISESYLSDEPIRMRRAILSEFLDLYPESPYRLKIEYLIAYEYFDDGEWLTAKPLLTSVWNEINLVTPDPTSYQEIWLNIGMIYAMEGDFVRLREWLAAIPGNQVTEWSNRERYIHLQHFIWGIKEPNSHYRSLRVLLGNSGINWSELDELTELPAPPSGVSMQDLKILGNQYGVPLKVAFREAGAQLITNSVTLFRLGHSAHLRAENMDPPFQVTIEPFLPCSLFFTQETLDRESTGYFLIHADTELPEGWRIVSDDEAAEQIGARLQLSIREIPEVTVEMITHGSSLYEGVAIEISGAPGDYTLQFAPILQPGTFDDIRPITLTEAEPTLRIHLDEMMSDTEDFSRGFFRINE